MLFQTWRWKLGCKADQFSLIRADVLNVESKQIIFMSIVRKACITAVIIESEEMPKWLEELFPYTNAKQLFEQRETLGGNGMERCGRVNC